MPIPSYLGSSSTTMRESILARSVASRIQEDVEYFVKKEVQASVHMAVSHALHRKVISF